MRIKVILILFLAVLAFFSCRKETVTSWDVDLTGPIVSSKLNIKNFLDDSLFESGPNGLLTLRVNREIAYIKVDSLLKLPDTTITNQFLWPSFSTTTLNPGQTINLLPPSPLVFNIANGVALKYSIIRKGILTIKFSNTITEPIDFKYLLPGVKKNNQAFFISETIPPGNNSLIKSYALDGYSIDLTAGGIAAFNTIIQNYTVSISNSANPAEITFGKGAIAELSYSEIIPQYALGYFGQQDIALDVDTATFDVFKNFNATNFALSDATFDFSIINEFGAEFNAKLNNINSINTVNNSSVGLVTQQLNSININRAIDVNGKINTSVKFISLNKNNSNILNYLSNLPNKITYGGLIKLNPLGNMSGYGDFAYFNTGIRVRADINIPLKFNANAFYLQSEAPIDLSNVNQLNNVNYGNIIINSRNGYPFEAVLQAYLLDENKTIIDSLFVPGNNIIPKGITDAQNLVTASTFQKLYIPFDANKLASFKKSKSILLKAKLNMPPNPPEITILDSYEIDVDMILDVNYRVKRK